MQLLAGAARELTWDRTAAAMVEVYHEAALAPVREATTLSRDALARERELIVSHREVAHKLIDERELVLGDYNELMKEVGPGRGLIGPHGSLPEDLQRMLLALSAQPALSHPLYGLLAAVFRAARAVARAVRRPCEDRKRRAPTRRSPRRYTL